MDSGIETAMIMCCPLPRKNEIIIGLRQAAMRLRAPRLIAALTKSD